MVVLDATIVNIALPQMQQALGFSTTSLSWVLNAYTLTFGGLLLLGGRAGDILGRRRVFTAGILVFTLASFLGGLATSSGWLLAARALQGVGAAIAAPTALSLITTNFAEGQARNRAFGVFSAVAVSGGAIGLLAGGILTSWLSWRWVLFVNVPIGLLLASLAPLYITESEQVRPRRGPHLHGRDDGAGLRLHPRRAGGLERPGDNRLLRRRRRPAGRLRLDRDQDPPAHHPAAPVP
jgi:MFS family permease